MTELLASPWTPGAPPAVAASAAAPTLRALFDEHFDFIWRAIRRLGLTDAEADDGAQRVFIIVSEKLGAIRPGKERAYLYGIAVRVVSDVRKNVARRNERDAERGVEEIATEDRPDVELDRARARACFDAAIAAMPIDLQTVFTLYELEGLTMVQIGELLEIPQGTVASRLRRARETFAVAMAPLRKRFGGSP